MEKAEVIIRQLNLKPHPEGGYYSESYRSTGILLPQVTVPSLSETRNFSTAIYFLLTRGVFSAFHRIRQDEIWHFYKGSPLAIHVITAGGEYFMHRLGNRLEKGERPQVVVPGGNWFAAALSEGKCDYALVGCTVAPGFDFSDFEMAHREALLREFPAFSKVIRQYARP